ncbi:uncharacterized protein [Lolium perenne]|nr:uncharacterized protein LOC127338180 [Lolium perenne]
MASGKRGNAASQRKAKKERTQRRTAKSKLSMKLLVDTKAQRVLYAEAGKEVVDFLFSVLALPLGRVAGLLHTQAGSMSGSVGNLYESVHELDGSYMCRDDAKAALVTPPAGGKLHQLVPGPGFVQGVLTYTVMDDLKVAPMSSISAVTLLNSFGITNIASLQEKTVELGHVERLGILRASLRSKKVLTDVFLGKKNKKRKAKDAFRHEAATRVVRRIAAWPGPWRPWHVSSRPCAACCFRRASFTACERVFRHRAGIVPGWRK